MDLENNAHAGWCQGRHPPDDPCVLPTRAEWEAMKADPDQGQYGIQTPPAFRDDDSDDDDGVNGVFGPGS